MGAANVIPGVSGGTIAFITGIYETLIHSLRSFDLAALGLLARFRVREFADHVDLRFLAALLTGVGLSILSLAKLLEYLFATHPVLLWAFFFGLILASVFFVARAVSRWSAGPVVLLVLGAGIAAAIALLKPASPNASLLYMVLSGAVAISSMIIPGLSGSFVLMLMGNYMLVLGAISEMDLGILLPFGVGCVAGLLLFARLLDWVFRNHHDAAVALVTGFIFGSLMIIWPWKREIYLRDGTGEFLLRKGERIIQGYDWFLPSRLGGETLGALALAAAGIMLVVIMERAAAGKSET